jgi:hypothetical protein
VNRVLDALFLDEIGRIGERSAIQMCYDGTFEIAPGHLISAPFVFERVQLMIMLKKMNTLSGLPSEALPDLPSPSRDRRVHSTTSDPKIKSGKAFSQITKAGSNSALGYQKISLKRSALNSSTNKLAHQLLSPTPSPQLGLSIKVDEMSEKKSKKSHRRAKSAIQTDLAPFTKK